MAARHLLALIISGALGAACSEAAESPQTRGQALFESRAASPSQLNLFSCNTCHDTSTPSTQIKTGAALAGSTLRPHYWGGQEADLLGSINACRRYFMFANTPWTATDANAEALYAYLVSLEPGNANAVPFTVVDLIEDIPHGDASRGQSVYARACQSCHGTQHDGVGRLNARVPRLPEDTLASHAEYSARVQRLIFIEKVRHGLFLGYGGDMPPFSKEVLSDGELSDVLQAMGILGL